MIAAGVGDRAGANKAPAEASPGLPRLREYLWADADYNGVPTTALRSRSELKGRAAGPWKSHIKPETGLFRCFRTGKPMSARLRGSVNIVDCASTLSVSSKAISHSLTPPCFGWSFADWHCSASIHRQSLRNRSAVACRMTPKIQANKERLSGDDFAIPSTHSLATDNFYIRNERPPPQARPSVIRISCGPDEEEDAAGRKEPTSQRTNPSCHLYYVLYTL